MSKQDRFKYGFMLPIAVFSMVIMAEPSFPYKLIIPLLYILVLCIPLTLSLIHI